MEIKKDFLSDKSDESLLNELRRVAKLLGKNTVTIREFNKHAPANVKSKSISNRFNGWNNGLKRAGLEITVEQNIPKEQILSEIGRVWNSLGHRPKYDEFEKLASFGTRPLKNQFGSFLKAVDAFIKSQNVEIASESKTPAKISVQEAFHTPEVINARRNEMKYGALVNFRGMQHAPLNELGVVFLFGMLAKELGFVVEAIGASFPDCEAKRLDEGGKFWKRIMIEFEYFSSNFQKHGHEIARCDLIVCWIHDWKNCPIEVLELSKIVEGQDKI